MRHHLRKLAIAAMLTLVVGVVAACGSGGGGGDQGGTGGGGGGGDKSVTIGYINWDENVANSYLTKALLEDELGYTVELKQADVGPLFQGVASGDLDAFLDVWLPGTHKQYWDQYQDQVNDLGVWYEGEANLGIGVPDYVEAQSIGDLADYGSEFDNQIVGIEPGAGIMTAANDAVEQYNLQGWSVTESSTPAMLSELKNAVESEQPIAVTAWKPHWMFTAYPLRYLEDPKGAMGGSEKLHAITSQSLQEEDPVSYALFDEMNLTEEQLGELELAINEADSPEEGVSTWLEDNHDVVQPWVDAAKQAEQG